MRNFIKDFVNGVKAGMRFHGNGKQLGASRVLITSIREYNIFVNDDAMMTMCGVPNDIPSAAMILLHNDSGQLCTGYLCNEIFLKQKAWFIKCCMVHEEGHIVNEDYKIPKGRTYILKRLFKEPMIEHYADQYAYNLLGEEYILFLMDLERFGVRHIKSRVQYLLKKR